MSPKTQSRSRF